MDGMKGAVVLAASMLCGSLLAGNGTASNRTFVQLRPVRNSFWHTATNSTLSLPVDRPVGATKATLSVRGVGYARDYTDITGSEFTLSLPHVSGSSDENVYCLTLAFDNGVEQKATLGLVHGYAAGPRAAARCLLSWRSAEWNRLVRRAVVSVPYGMTSLTLNGESVNPGLDGDQGWCAIGKARSGETYDLTMSVDGFDYAASLQGFGLGSLLFVY